MLAETGLFEVASLGVVLGFDDEALDLEGVVFRGPDVGSCVVVLGEDCSGYFFDYSRTAAAGLALCGAGDWVGIEVFDERVDQGCFACGLAPDYVDVGKGRHDVIQGWS